MVSRIGVFRHANSYGYYLKHIKPMVSIRKCKRRVAAASNERKRGQQMTDWKTVHDSRTTTPEALDGTSSSSTVYERRNIRREAVTVGGGEGTATMEQWVYEQREYTREEYDMMRAPAIQSVQQTLSGIELAIAMLG